MQVVRQPF